MERINVRKLIIPAVDIVLTFIGLIVFDFMFTNGGLFPALMLLAVSCYIYARLHKKKWFTSPFMVEVIIAVIVVLVGGIIFLIGG